MMLRRKGSPVCADSPIAFTLWLSCGKYVQLGEDSPARFHLRDLLPCSFYIVHLSLNAKLTLQSYLPSDSGDFSGERCQSVNHA